MSATIEPVLIRKVIDARGMSPADIQQQINARLYEALRDRDLAEGNPPYPTREERGLDPAVVMQIRIDLDFAERKPWTIEGPFAPGEMPVDMQEQWDELKRTGIGPDHPDF